MESSRVLASSDSVLLVCDGKEDRLSVDMLVVGDEGTRSVCVLLSSCVVCKVPFSDTRYASNLSKHSIAGGGGP